MTAPPTPEALVEALNAAIELQRCLAPLDQVHWSAEEPSVCLRLFRETETQAVIDLMKAVRGFEDTVSLAPLLAALQQVTAERDEAREVVARCNNSFGSYSYHLNPHPAEQIEKVKWQARSEWQRAEAANAEIARLRAEGEALQADANAIGARLGNTSQYDDPKALRDLCWEAGNFLARRIVQPALARAATAREGA